MTLSGSDPNDPTPQDLRELILGSGEGGQASSSRPVLLWGNKLAPGTETVNVVDKTHPIADGADAIARCGKRSELYWMYKKYIKHDPDATIFLMAVQESGGTAATVPFTIAGGASATAASGLIFTILGVDYTVPVQSGDLLATIVANAVLFLNDFEDASLPIVATDASPLINVASSLKGPRHGMFLGGPGWGVRARFSDACGLTVTKGAVVAGTVEDDGTTAFTNFVNAEFYYNVCPWITAAPLTTDNQTGELLDNIRAQDQPLNGKDQIMVCPWVGTNATAITAATALNSWLAHMVWQENSEWMPGMLAASFAAVKRRNEISHPCANFAGWSNTDNTPWDVPPPALTTDYPTRTEIKAGLNNGFCPIGVHETGKTYIVRDVTTRSETSAGDKDYKARPGHIRSGIAFVWGTDKVRWAKQKRPFVDDDPAAGAMPTANTSTPAMMKGMAQKVIDDCCASKPFGIYDGPILAPSKAKWMKERVVSAHAGASLLTLGQQLIVVQHLYKSETKINEVGDAY